ncbi:flagellar biosynthetic protein FliR [Aestuariivirga sp.]|uniref:flagellar biosynthetic protein FliR n=1 Tax=Aestuariivirga sp. TaxID=2650926 RepID=UPI0025BB31D2|nr:flagellar biosynthetic protein FliR [Aestuariivirga sp.]MCA3554260.1 flagellar biosynthetic protein FliR [Aestuariivirga sp.]
MTEPLQTQLLGLVLLFCRIGGCLLLAPGLSSPRVPVHVRLFVALAITAAVSPMIVPEIVSQTGSASPDRQIWLIMQETVIGALLGLLARCFLLALQFAATAISNFIGLAGIPGIPLEEADTGSPLATLVSTAAVTLIFAMGLHIELLKAVIDSYAVMPPGAPPGADALLSNLLQTLNETWLLALRLSGPFLLYGVIVNFALGMGNRFAQQISMYHATTGAVMLGGFLLFYLVWVDWAMIFAGAYRTWLVEGGF